MFHGFIPSSIRSQSLPAKFPQAISTASSRSAFGLAPSLFPRLHHVQHPVCSLPAQFPQAICTVSSRPVSLSLPAKSPQAISTASSRPSGLAPSQRSFPKLFSTLLSRPASGLAPSQRSFPKLFPRLHPVQHPVSLPPAAKFPRAISTGSSRPASGLAPSQRSFPKLFPRLHPVQHPVSLPPSEVSPSYFPRFPVQHIVSLPPSEVSPSYFHDFIPSSIRSRSLPAKFPQAISTASSRPASGLAPSQRNFPKLFPRLHPVQHPVSLPPSEVSLSYFHGFIPSSIHSRSLPAKFPQAISTASSRPASGLAPSQRNFPKLFPRLHPVHPVSLPPSAVSPSDFHGFIPSSIRSRSLPAKFPQAISTASSRPASGLTLPPSEVSPSYSHMASSRPASGLAPSQRNFPKLFPRLHPVEHLVSLPPSAIFPSYFHGFIPSSIRSRSLPAKSPQAISTASTRPSDLAPSQRSFPKLFSTLLSRPASGLAPSQRSFPKLFPRLHPVQHPVSLPPAAKFPQAISTGSSRPASGLAPSQRSFPKLFPRLHPVQHPVSLPPSEVSPSYFPRFPVQHTVSLPPSEVSPSYFHDFIPSSIRSRSLPAKFPQAISTASSRPASGLAPSQRNFLKLFPRLHPVQHPVSLPPSEVSLSYFHGFIPSSIHSRSLPAKFPQAISTASSRPASGLAPSQRNFPKLFPRLHPVHPVSLPPSAVSPSYFHGFIPSSIRSRSLPAKFPQAISTASSRPASGLAPSQRSFPKL